MIDKWHAHLMVTLVRMFVCVAMTRYKQTYSLRSLPPSFIDIFTQVKCACQSQINIIFQSYISIDMCILYIYFLYEHELIEPVCANRGLFLVRHHHRLLLLFGVVYFDRVTLLFYRKSRNHLLFWPIYLRFKRGSKKKPITIRKRHFLCVMLVFCSARS